MGELTAGGESKVAQDHLVYEGLLEASNRAQPHREGMTLEEFNNALIDPLVATTTVSVGETTAEIPQLCPISKFEWLNSNFYEGKFPEQMARGDVMHFADFEGIEPSEQVVARIRKLAEANGVIAIDFPGDLDPEYPQRVLDFLGSIGVGVEETQELGTQTYYAGQVTLKRDHAKRDEPLGLIKSFEQKVREGSYDPVRTRNGASLLTTVDETQADFMNGFYDEAFQQINGSSPVRQGLTPEEFRDMVVHDQDVAKIVSSTDGQVTALCIMGEDLDKFDWVNPEYFEVTLPDRARQKQIVYFPAIAADPEHVGDNTKKIVGLIAELVETGDNEIVVAFDCCDLNKGFLDVFLQDMINNTPEATIDFKTVATQRFWSLSLKAA